MARALLQCSSLRFSAENPMKPKALLAALESAADALAIKVTYEPLLATVGHGGLCRVRGTYRVIIDKRATDHERIATLAHALAGFDTAALELDDAVRDVLQYYSARRAS